MTGFKSPNYTQTPNDLFDNFMRDMKESELKVVLCAIRKILGYHKEYDPISFTQFEEMTGLSREGVATGIAAAIERGILEEVGTGARGVKIYGLVINPDQSEITTSQNSRPVLVRNSDQSTPSTSQNFRHTKESDSKEKNQKKNSAAVSSSKKSAKSQTPKQSNAAQDTLPHSARPSQKKEITYYLEHTEAIDWLRGKCEPIPDLVRWSEMSATEQKRYIQAHKELSAAGVAFEDYEALYTFARQQNHWRNFHLSQMTGGVSLWKQSKVIPLSKRPEYVIVNPDAVPVVPTYEDDPTAVNSDYPTSLTPQMMAALQRAMAENFDINSPNHQKGVDIHAILKRYTDSE